VGMMNLENCVDSVFANNMPLDVPVVIIAKWAINNFGKIILVFSIFWLSSPNLFPVGPAFFLTYVKSVTGN
jgi:hypothetical protein